MKKLILTFSLVLSLCVHFPNQSNAEEADVLVEEVALPETVVVFRSYDELPSIYYGAKKAVWTAAALNALSQGFADGAIVYSPVLPTNSVNDVNGNVNQLRSIHPKDLQLTRDLKRWQPDFEFRKVFVDAFMRSTSSDIPKSDYVINDLVGYMFSEAKSQFGQLPRDQYARSKFVYLQKEMTLDYSSLKEKGVKNVVEITYTPVLMFTSPLTKNMTIMAGARVAWINIQEGRIIRYAKKTRYLGKKQVKMKHGEIKKDPSKFFSGVNDAAEEMAKKLAKKFNKQPNYKKEQKSKRGKWKSKN